MPPRAPLFVDFAIPGGSTLWNLSVWDMYVGPRSWGAHSDARLEGWRHAQPPPCAHPL